MCSSAGGNDLEAVAGVTAFATDKTGTLTTGKLSVASVRVFEGGVDLDAVRGFESTFVASARIAADSTLTASGGTDAPVATAQLR